MSTALRVFLWAVISLVVVVLLAVAALRVFDWNVLKDEISARLSDRLGQEVAIRGDLDVDIGLDAIRAQARDIRIEDTLPRSGPLLTIERLRLGLALRPLLGGEVVFDRITVVRPQVTLVRTEAGEVNWDLEALRAEEPRAAPPALPAVRQLEIEDARVIYRDEARDETLRASIAEAQARVSREGTLRATGTGEIESRELRFGVRADAVEDGNWRLRAQTQVADASLSVTGTLLEPDLNVDLRVPQPAQLGFLPVPGLAEIEDIRLTTRLTRDAGQWWLDGLELALGERKLNGDVRADLEQAPPMIYATLYLNELAVPEPEIEAPEELIPPVEVPTAPLELVNLRADLEIGRISNVPLSIQDVNLLVQLYGGRLTVRPLSASLGSGSLEGGMVYDAARAFPELTARLTLRGFELAPAIPGEENPVTGTVHGHVDLHSRGENLEELAANLNGQLLFVMTGGSVTATWVEALDIDVAEWLAAAAQPGTVKTSIRCALVAFEVENGELIPRPVVVDTEDSVITLDGGIDLGTEDLELTLNAFPKDPSVLAAQGPIRVEGSLVDPSIDVLTEEVAGRAAAALALGALAGPFAALIPLIEPGLAEDQNCRQLLGDEPRAPPSAGKQ